MYSSEQEMDGASLVSRILGTTVVQDPRVICNDSPRAALPPYPHANITTNMCLPPLLTLVRDLRLRHIPPHEWDLPRLPPAIHRQKRTAVIILFPLPTLSFAEAELLPPVETNATDGRADGQTGVKRFDILVCAIRTYVFSTDRDRVHRMPATLPRE